MKFHLPMIQQRCCGDAGLFFANQLQTAEQPDRNRERENSSNKLLRQGAELLHIAAAAYTYRVGTHLEEDGADVGQEDGSQQIVAIRGAGRQICGPVSGVHCIRCMHLQSEALKPQSQHVQQAVSFAWLVQCYQLICRYAELQDATGVGF